MKKFITMNNIMQQKTSSTCSCNIEDATNDIGHFKGCPILYIIAPEFHKEWRKKFESFYWEKDEYSNRILGIKEYQKFLDDYTNALLEEFKKKKKQDPNLEPGFNITAEYRLGEIRGYNQALDEIITQFKI